MTQHPLTFSALRAANRARLPTFRNARGEIAHAATDGSDWSPGEWLTAVVGEMGEAANLLKKVRRGDLSLDDARADLAKEFADVVTYLDLLAMQVGVDLGQATAAKFDEVSIRVGSPVRIADHQGSLAATSPGLLAAIEKAAKQFESYAHQHRAKGTAQADRKAEVNAAIAAEMRLAIARATGAAR